MAMTFDDEPSEVKCERCATPLTINPMGTGPLWSCPKCGWHEMNEVAPGGTPIHRDLSLSDADYQTREVYAHYGDAVSAANTLEHELIIFLTLVQNTAKPRATQGSWDHFFSKNIRLTMGVLVQKIQPHLGIDLSLQKDLNDAVKVRNDLAHYYFRERALHFCTFESREAMITELSLAGKSFLRVEGLVTEARRRKFPGLI